MPKGLLVMSHAMEDVESLATRALLKRAGFEIITGTFEHTLNIDTAYHLEVICDGYMRETHINDFDFLIIPGGPYVKNTIDTRHDIQDLALAFSKKDKLIAAICAGPRFLGRAGLLEGVDYTAFPGSEEDGKDGNYHPEKAAVTDKNIITSRGAGTVYAFVHAIVTYYNGEKAADTLLEAIQHPSG